MQCNITLIAGGLYIYFLGSIPQQVVFANFTEKEYISFHFIPAEKGEFMGKHCHKS